MKVKLIDVDSKIPNLALMKISSFFKKNGYEVGFDIEDPDLVCASVIYKKNVLKLDEILNEYGKDVCEFGGSGYSLTHNLPDDVEFIKPDYDLYPSKYAQGFTTRGCIRNCSFCIVPIKEGKLVRWQHPKEFYDDRFDTIWIMDNNWIADKQQFMETSGWILDHGLKVLECGFDVRITDEDIVKRISDMKFPKGIHFAFDNSNLRDVVKEKILLLKEYGINTRHDVIFYVYCDSPKQVDDAVRRCRILKKLNTNPFVMYNIDRNRTPRVKKLQHWANRRQLFWSCDFDEFSWESKYHKPKLI